MSNGKSVTNVDIYDRLERLRLEITKQIDATSRDHKIELADLRRQFEQLESGRLTRLESAYNELVLKVQAMSLTSKNAEKTLSNKFVALGAIGMLLLGCLASAIFYWFIGKATGGIK